MPSWTVRKFGADEDFEPIAELARIVYPGGATSLRDHDKYLRDQAYLNWKYRENPQGVYMAVCEADGEVIGFQMLAPILIKVDHALSRWAWGGDLMVHPQFRRQGIFLAMKRSTFEQAKGDISLDFGTGSLETPTSRGILKHLEYVHLGDVAVLKRYLSPFSALHAISIQGELTLPNVFNYLGSIAELLSITLLGNLASFSDHSYDEEKQIQLREIKPLRFGAEFDQLWNEVSESLPIAVVRNKEYLSWRYANPCATYVGFRADKEESLCGYSIMAYGSSGKLKIAWVADLLAKKPTITNMLLRECLRRAKQDDVHVVIMWDTRSTGRILSRSLRLVRAWRKIPMTVHFDDPHLPKDLISNISNWYVTVGDTVDSI